MLSSLSPQNPHKRPCLSPSPSKQSYYTYDPQPSIESLTNDRLASLNKLQSTWEDIIQKYSTIPPSEADEIDLDTGEIVIDHGHLQSLHDSVLWDPLDSEREDDDDYLHEYDTEEIPDHNVIPTHQEEQQDQGNETLPSEKEILNQFGEKYGRDILNYLQNRETLKPPSRESTLWTAPENEPAIFARAKTLWRKYRDQHPSPIKQKFDKESFERAVFGANITARTAFEEAVFGKPCGLDIWSDDDETKINQAGRTTMYDVDFTPQSPIERERSIKKRRIDETPRKRARTPSCKGILRSAGLSAKAKEKLRGNVVSGLVVGASDEDDLFENTSPCTPRKSGKKVIPETPVISGRARTESSSSSRAQSVKIDDMGTLDTKRQCGDVGYRCTKAFCFKCVA
jgi:hypothetical protein